MKTAVVSFGRFNSPTIGHAKLVNAVIGLAKKRSADALIYASHTEDKKKNPLSYKTKIEFLKKVSGGVVKVDAANKVKNLFDLLKELNGKYDSIVVLAGSDRVNEYDVALKKYNGKDYSYKSIEVVSAGERDPDSDDTTSAISGTKIREFAIDGDYSSFRKYSFPGATDAMVKKLYNEIRKVYNINEHMEMSHYFFVLNGSNEKSNEFSELQFLT